MENKQDVIELIAYAMRKGHLDPLDVKNWSWRQKVDYYIKCQKYDYDPDFAYDREREQEMISARNGKNL